MLQNKITEKN